MTLKPFPLRYLDTREPVLMIVSFVKDISEPIRKLAVAHTLDYEPGLYLLRPVYNFNTSAEMIMSCGEINHKYRVYNKETLPALFEVPEDIKPKLLAGYTLDIDTNELLPPKYTWDSKALAAWGEIQISREKDLIMAVFGGIEQ